MSQIRLLLVDDSLDFLDSAARFLSTDPDIQVAGRALDGRQALRLVPQLNPDLVLMDWSMPGMSGLEATRAIKAQPNPPRVVILTLHDLGEYRAAAEHACADAFIAKTDFGLLLIPLIHHLCADPRRQDNSRPFSPAPDSFQDAHPDDGDSQHGQTGHT